MTAIGEVLVRHLSLIGDLPEEDREALLRIDGEIRWVERGALVDLGNGRLAVLDWEQLLDVAEFDPFYLHLKDGSGPPHPVEALVHSR